MMNDFNYKHAWWMTLAFMVIFLVLAVGTQLEWRSTQRELRAMVEVFGEMPELGECIEMWGNPGGEPRCMTYRELTWDQKQLSVYYLENREQLETILEEIPMECPFDVDYFERRIEFLEGQLDSCGGAYAEVKHDRDYYKTLFNEFPRYCSDGMTMMALEDIRMHLKECQNRYNNLINRVLRAECELPDLE